MCNHDNWHKEIEEVDYMRDGKPDQYSRCIAVCDDCGKKGMLITDSNEDGDFETVDWSAYDE